MISAYYHDPHVRLYAGDPIDVLGELPDTSAHCVVTSPPAMRKGGSPGCDSPEQYVQRLRAVFTPLRRVLADTGTAWLNLGDTHSAAPKSPQSRGNLLGIPWRVAFALQEDGWIVRNAIVWHKPNALPDAAHDHLTAGYGMLFLLVKQQKYWFDLDAIRQPRTDNARAHRNGSLSAISDGQGKYSRGKNPGDVWQVLPHQMNAAHVAAFPADLPLRAITAGCPPGGVVLDPFCGAGSTLRAARQLGRQAIGFGLDEHSCAIGARELAEQPAA